MEHGTVSVSVCFQTGGFYIGENLGDRGLLDGRRLGLGRGGGVAEEAVDDDSKGGNVRRAGVGVHLG